MGGKNIQENNIYGDIFLFVFENKQVSFFDICQHFNYKKSNCSEKLKHLYFFKLIKKQKSFFKKGSSAIYSIDFSGCFYFMHKEFFKNEYNLKKMPLFEKCIQEYLNTIIKIKKISKKTELIYIPQLNLKNLFEIFILEIGAIEVNFLLKKKNKELLNLYSEEEKNFSFCCVYYIRNKENFLMYTARSSIFTNYPKDLLE